jgi:hypothetical protein
VPVFLCVSRAQSRRDATFQQHRPWLRMLPLRWPFV